MRATPPRQVELADGSDLTRWAVKLPPAAFDDGAPGGAALRSQLRELGNLTGAGWVQLEVQVIWGGWGRCVHGCFLNAAAQYRTCLTGRALRVCRGAPGAACPASTPAYLPSGRAPQFPRNANDYPTHPFKLRVVVRARGGRREGAARRRTAPAPSPPYPSPPAAFALPQPPPPRRRHAQWPRCVPYTGHVTIGGAICMQALTLSGGAGGWHPAMSVGAILNVRLLCAHAAAAGGRARGARSKGQCLPASSRHSAFTSARTAARPQNTLTHPPSNRRSL